MKVKNKSCLYMQHMIFKGPSTNYFSWGLIESDRLLQNNTKTKKSMKNELNKSYFISPQ